MKRFLALLSGTVVAAGTLDVAPPAAAATAPAVVPRRLVPSGPPAPTQGPLPQTGCTSTTTAAVCELWAKPGQLVLPGAAAPVPICSFAGTAAAPATTPGPVLVVDQGDAVTRDVHNGFADNLALARSAVTGLATDR